MAQMDASLKNLMYKWTMGELMDGYDPKQPGNEEMFESLNESSTNYKINDSMESRLGEPFEKA